MLWRRAVLLLILYITMEGGIGGIRNPLVIKEAGESKAGKSLGLGENQSGETRYYFY